MADFTIKQGDTKPPLSATLKDYQNGVLAAVDLTSASTVKLVASPIKSPSSVGIVKDATIVDAPNGKVQCVFTTTDTATAGEFFAEWHVVFLDGSREKFPTVGQFRLNIEAALPES